MNDDIPLPPKPPFDFVKFNVTIMVLLVVILSIGMSYLMYEHKKATNYCEMLVNYGDRARLVMNMNNKSVIANTKLYGRYSPDSDIYCIWNESKDINADTELHEYMHHVIYKEDCYEGVLKVSCKQHFCGDTN